MKNTGGLPSRIRCAAVAKLDCELARTKNQHDFFHHQRRFRQRRGPRRPGRRRQALPVAGASGRSRQPHLARLLSASAADGKPAVNARDRIGKGPWQNAKGVVIAKDVDDLHSNNNKINKETGLSEKGETINARGDKPNMHDILTGSQSDGRAFTGSDDMTCRNWTSSTIGTAILGHHDRQGLKDDEPSRSWNSSHPSRGIDANGGCSQEGLRSSGGNGLFYCFAAN